MAGVWWWRHYSLAKKYTMTMWSWKGLKHHGLVMGHRWGSHGGTWKMGTWGWNIALEMLYVLMGICLGGSDCPALKCVSSCSLKLDKFWWVISFKAHVPRHAVSDRPKPAPSHHQNMTCFYVNLLSGPRCPWKPMLGCLEVSDAFTTCHWNNLGDQSKNNFKSQRIGKSGWFFHENQHSLRVLNTQNRPVLWFWFFEIPATVISWFCF